MKQGCLIAPTGNDIRDVMVEGPSGLLNVAPPWLRPKYRAFEAPGYLAQWCAGGVFERRGARASPRVEHRHAVG